MSQAPPGPAFSQLALPPATLANLQRLGYHAMTPIQAQSLPVALAGHDLLAQAKTGSGKTAAFALVLLANLKPGIQGIQGLVLCPTRELAEQVGQEIRRLARAEEHIKVLTLCGGAPIRPQLASLAHSAHIVVGTPGRLLDHVTRGSLVLHDLNTLVLDEADRMLDMGFHDDIVRLAQACPPARQTLLYSATFPERIAELARRFLRAPREVKLLEQHAPTKIRQVFYQVEESERLDAVARLLEHYRPQSTLAFCNTKQQCRELLALLQQRGYVALALHGELDQRERDQVLIQFDNRSCSVLVATDVAARGLDIAELEAVINVDITPDPEVHVHRIGRTGRVDAEGWALSLVGPRESGYVGRIEAAAGTPCEWQQLGALKPARRASLAPPMATLQILGGRKEKIRAGDVLGALTGTAGFRAAQVGKIQVNAYATYVAVERAIADEALRKLSSGKVKGKTVRVHRLK
ncbi:MAG: ATP-dependent RNA helicase DbpA [Planctomycetes bacterium]|nr:ATP-dependent RNA helicase DbpA [Planctomycetota bacterium]